MAQAGNKVLVLPPSTRHGMAYKVGVGQSLFGLGRQAPPALPGHGIGRMVGEPKHWKCSPGGRRRNA